MNTTFKKKRTNSNSWIFSITVALILYVLLLTLFSPAKIKIAKSNIKDKSHIFMLTTESSKTPSQNQLRHWLQNGNPTLIVKPNNIYGYSSILNPQLPVSLKDTSINLASVLSPTFFFSSQFTISPIHSTPLPTTKLFSRLDLSSSYPSPPQIAPTKVALLKYPCVKNYYTGKPIHVKFKDGVQSLVKKENPEKPTILDLNIPSKSGFYPIVNIVSSCGSSDLDNAALKSLTTSKLSNDKSLQGKLLKVYVNWKRQ